MPLFKTVFLSNQTKALLKIQNPFCRSLPLSRPFLVRTLNSSSQVPTRKPLSLLFQEAVGLAEKSGGDDGQSEKEGEKDELIRELMELERQIRNLRENQTVNKKEKKKVEREKPKNVVRLADLFGCEKKEEKVVRPRRKKSKELEKGVTVRSRERGEVVVFKEFSQLVEVFIRHLYAKGYFNKANFLVDNKLDLGYFDSTYGRDFIKHAAFEFGKDHQEIANWLPGNHLKNVVLFGCPSLDKNNIFAAKRLRKFFKIQENTVCNQCILKNSCKHVNADVWGVGTKNLLLVDVMKVITLYALHEVPPKLVVPDEVKDSVERLVKDIIKLSQSMSQS